MADEIVETQTDYIWFWEIFESYQEMYVLIQGDIKKNKVLQ